MTNNRNRRGPRSAATPTTATDLPAEKITPRSEEATPPTTSPTPSNNTTTIDPLTGRPIRDLRAIRAAERAARAARSGGSTGASSEGEAEATPSPAPAVPPAAVEPTTTRAAKPKPAAKTKRSPARSTVTASAETVTPASPAAPMTPTPPAPQVPQAAPLPQLPQLLPERITPKATATASAPAQLPTERITKATSQPEPAATPERSSRAATPTALPSERITPRNNAPAAPPASSYDRNAKGQNAHRTATSHSNPILRTLPGERINPRRPNERRPNETSGGEDSGFEQHTYSVSELRLDEQEKRAAELLHPGMYWYRMDLHCHTPRSTVCYREPNATMLRILQKAEERGVDILAITDHNTVAGYADLMRDRELVERMEAEGRLTTDERYRLGEYRRIFGKMLVLPGFEFSATFGFHILCIFPPIMSIRRMEHLLMSMGITEEKMLLGSPEVGATTDVLNVYRLVNAEGGFCIGAHANSSNGIVMNGFNFGGQTKIAYTQDPNLAALEVTDLESSSRRSTANFFNGSKPEYPRRMHCIQSSDSHRIYRDPDERQRILGVGDRTTEVLLTELSFPAMKELFASTDWERVRPTKRGEQPAFDAIKAARAVGANLVQAFHDRLPMRRMSSHHILRDIAAFANTNGGTIYLGVPPQASQPIRGVDNPTEVIDVVRGEIQRNIVPPLTVNIDMRTSEGKTVVLINVPKGADRPYALEGSQIYIRQESETNLAMRDEIVQLIREAMSGDTGETIFAARAANAQLSEEARRDTVRSQAPSGANGQATAQVTATNQTPPVSNETRLADRREDERRFERRAERRERYIQQREQPTQASSLPQPSIASFEVDAVATPTASISEPAPQVEPALVALAAPSLAAATIAAEPIDEQLAHPEEESQEAIGDEQTLSASARRRNRRRRKGQSADESEVDSEAAASTTTEELPSIELGEPIGVESMAEGGPDYSIEPPRTGVEIVATEGTGNTLYHTMKDLRNGNLVHHVSRHSARRLWRYAITQREHGLPKPEDITWLGDIGIWRSTVRADLRRYDLAQRDAQGNFHAYYGVTEDGLHGPWMAFTSITPTVETDDEEISSSEAVVSTPAIRFVNREQASVLDFAELIESYFNQMDDPYQRAIAVSSYGHAPVARLPRRERTTPLDEGMIAEQEDTYGAHSVFDEATRFGEEVFAHSGADERILVEEFSGITLPSYLLPEDAEEYIVVIDSNDVPEAAEISDDGSGSSLAEAREAWTMAIPEPQRRSRNRSRRTEQGEQAQPAATQTEPLADSAQSQAEPLTDSAAEPPTSDIEQAAEQAVARLSKPSRSRNRRPTANQEAETAAAEATAPAEVVAAPEAVVAQPSTKANRSRRAKTETPAAATSNEDNAEVQAASSPAATAVKSSRPRIRVTRNDLRRGRDEDPNNPDTAPIPAYIEGEE